MALLLVGLLALSAGCSGFGGGGEATPGESTMTSTTTGDAMDTATPAEDGTATTDDGTATTDDGTATTDDGSSGSDGESAAATGKMAVVVDGERIDLSEAIEGDDSFRMDEEAPDTWHANGGVTLASVLAEADVEASADSLSYDGERFTESTDGTQLVYRVDGEPVDPESYQLEDGDEVWVLVLTSETNASVPGDYIPPERLHVHGSVDFVVDGEELNFSRDKWQAASHNSHFHFEGGHANPWHAHAWSVTPAYAFSTLEDIEVTADSVTYNGTTYSGDEVSITVNGEEVDPTDYYLKDGDAVRIVIEEG